MILPESPITLKATPRDGDRNRRLVPAPRLSDFPSPDIVRDDDHYYMTAMSLHFIPGLPILYSSDLNRWTLINHAVRKLPRHYNVVRPGCGIWAPALRKHAGLYWIFFAMPDEGIFVTTASHPTGNWSEPHLLQAGQGLIDPSPVWDSHGRAYLVHAYSMTRAGIQCQLRVRPMAPDGSRLLGEGQAAMDFPAHYPKIHRPKFYHLDNFYYILAAAREGHSEVQLALRSRSPFGPYETCTMKSGDASSERSVGAGALVDTPQGEWWYVFTKNNGPHGTTVQRTPVKWRSAWPTLISAEGPAQSAEVGTQLEMHQLEGELTVADEFERRIWGKSILPEHWHWNANPEDSWSTLGDRPGWLRLNAFPSGCVLARTKAPQKFEEHAQTPATPTPTLVRFPQILLRRFPSRSFQVETRLEICSSDDRLRAGLLVLGKEYAGVLVRPDFSRAEGGAIAEQVINGTVVAETTLPGCIAKIQLTVHEGKCTFSVSTDTGEFVHFPHAFCAVEGVDVGARIGLMCMQEGAFGNKYCDPTRVFADFDYFRVLTACDDCAVFEFSKRWLEISPKNHLEPAGRMTSSFACHALGGKQADNLVHPGKDFGASANTLTRVGP